MFGPAHMKRKDVGTYAINWNYILILRLNFANGEVELSLTIKLCSYEFVKDDVQVISACKNENAI